MDAGRAMKDGCLPGPLSPWRERDPVSPSVTLARTAGEKGRLRGLLPVEGATQAPVKGYAVVKGRKAPVLQHPYGKGKVLLTLLIGTRVTIGATAPGNEGFYPLNRKRGIGWIERDLLWEPGPHARDEHREREAMLATARLFLKTPYLWGGRSIHIPELKTISTGVDCSGLINLVFRVHGIDLPRDAHEQWMKTERMSPEALKPADLIFVGPQYGPMSAM